MYNLAQIDAIARAFHESYERQAPANDYETREASRVEWESVPENNKRLMRAVVTDLLNRRIIIAGAALPLPRAEGCSCDTATPLAHTRVCDLTTGCTCGASGGMDGHALTCNLNRVSYDR